MGIEDFEFQNSVTISPNPSSGVFNISFKNVLTENTQVVVYNMLGQKVFSDTIMSVNEYSLPLQTLQAGTYLLKIATGEQRIVKKLEIRK